jgi:hypothetical protein
VRVTEALSIIHNPVYDRLDPQILHDKASWGTGFHKACYKWAQAEIGVEKDSPYYQGLIGFQEWFDIAVDSLISAEKQYTCELRSNVHIEGTPDLIVIMKGDKKPTVVDIKTSTGIYYHQHVQLSAYAKMAGATRRLIWQLKDKTTSKYKIHEIPVADLDFDWNMFLSAVEWKIKVEAKCLISSTSKAS